jgi:hypothetical protein
VSNELVVLNLVIADRTYRIKVQPQDEEVVRRTAKTINDKLIEYKTVFAGKDMQDYLAMVLVWFATEQTAGISKQMNLDDVTTRLQGLEKLIDQTLKEEV